MGISRSQAGWIISGCGTQLISTKHPQNTLCGLLKDILDYFMALGVLSRKQASSSYYTLCFYTLQSKELKERKKEYFTNKYETISICMMTRLFHGTRAFVVVLQEPDRQPKQWVWQRWARENEKKIQYRKKPILPGRKNPPTTVPKQQQESYRRGKNLSDLTSAGKGERVAILGLSELLADIQK